MASLDQAQSHHQAHPAGGNDVWVIEALRGLAAVLVLISHYVVFVRDGAGPWGMAAVGVDLFFVLSGFVFARALANGRMAWGPHLVRRFFRLYPLYLLALLLYAALQPTESRWSGWWPHAFMLHTTGDLALAARYNVAFWSLPPEVEFYLVLPLLAAVTTAVATRARAALWALLGLALALKLGLVALATPGEAPDSLRGVLTVHLPGLLVEFLLGSAAAIATGHVNAPHLGTAWSRKARFTAALTGGLLFLMLLLAYRSQLATPAAAAQASTWLTGSFGLLAAVAFALLLLGLRLASEPGDSAVSHRSASPVWRFAAAWAGRLSYGLYLFHNAAPVIVQRWWPGLDAWPLVIVSLALTVLLAAALHLAVEAPCRRYGRALAERWSQRATTTRMSGDSR